MWTLFSRRPVLLWIVALCTLASSGCGRSAPTDPVQPMSLTAERFLRLGSEALQRHDFERAFAFADSVAVFSSDLADIPFLRGRIYAELANFDKADSAYRVALAMHPTYPGAWHNLGNTAFRRQEFSEAIRYYLREFQAHPDPRPWREIARSYVELGKTDSALYAFEQALSIDSEFAPAHFGLALLLDDLGDHEGALREAQRALVQEPGNLEYRYHAASYLVRLNRWDEALDLLETVVAQWPWHQGAHYNMAQAYMRLGRVEEAQVLQERAEALRTLQALITQRETAVRVHPGDPYAHATLGSLLRRAGRYDDAMHAYRVALYIAPGNPDFRNNVAVLHLLRGDTLFAIRSFRTIVQADTSNTHALINLGSLYALSGDPENARRAWEAALRIEPDNQAALRSLAKLASSERLFQP